MNLKGDSCRFLIIIPTFNESKNISILLSKLLEFRANRNDFRVLIVDDGSPDGTSGVAREMNLDWVSILERNEKRGLGSAYKAGFAWGNLGSYKYYVEMDADGSHRVEDLSRLLDAEPTLDLVIGSRWIDGGHIVNWPRHRKWLSIGGNFYARKMLGAKVKDSTSGFRRIKCDALNEINLEGISSKGYGFQIEVVSEFIAKGFTVSEIPITFIEREYGTSKMTLEIALEAWVLVTKRSQLLSFRSRSLSRDKKAI